MSSLRVCSHSFMRASLAGCACISRHSRRQSTAEQRRQRGEGQQRSDADETEHEGGVGLGHRVVLETGEQHPIEGGAHPPAAGFHQGEAQVARLERRRRRGSGRSSPRASARRPPRRGRTAWTCRRTCSGSRPPRPGGPPGPRRPPRPPAGRASGTASCWRLPLVDRLAGLGAVLGQGPQQPPLVGDGGLGVFVGIDADRQALGSPAPAPARPLSAPARPSWTRLHSCGQR